MHSHDALRFRLRSLEDLEPALHDKSNKIAGISRSLESHDRSTKPTLRICTIPTQSEDLHVSLDLRLEGRVELTSTVSPRFIFSNASGRTW